ncbi:VCBS repeat-containing protein [Mesobacillus foraminis]|uniref:VCBS repeat-containing protein n=1 Tax=Mesobacillus foraminis TaxID=279826 RepID=UPI001BEC5CE9|nr:VCBS repeat-containing protein [Mesobacillus foraminis]MBT2758032.1 VCBS repeat-containing protein [Mesobacillus foraminis]
MDTYQLRRAIYYYHMKVQETNDPYYWFYLADTQVRAGLTKEARQSIDKALSFPKPFPSRQRLLEIQAKLHSALPRENNPNTSIAASKRGDIDGDGIIDNVLLTGNKAPDSPFWRNITLFIQNGKTNHSQEITLKNNAGYNPTLFLGDFTGNKVNDILVVIDTGGSGGAIYAYVFSHINGQMNQIFNSDTFNKNFMYGVTYQDQYKVSVINQKQREKYVVDLTIKGKNYLNDIYNDNGVLKGPIEGWVNPLSGLYPVDFNRDGTYELESYQRIAGRYNADSLGFVLNVLKWNGQVFRPERKNVAIFGGEI